MENGKRGKQKSDKQILKNYLPVSLLPICGKIFERLIYHSLFEYFIENDLVSPNQSGFKPGDSCTNQLTATDLGGCARGARTSYILSSKTFFMQFLLITSWETSIASMYS